MQNTALKSTILVVDDEPANLRVLKHLLAEHYTLAFAKNGPEALRVAEAQLPDLILLDVMMPGMTGFQLFQDPK